LFTAALTAFFIDHSPVKLLILDNYDSFTYNLLHLVQKVSDLPVEVKRNDEIGIEAVAEFGKIILSPGPGLPAAAGIMPGLLKRYHREKSIFGVCLGLQAIGECFGNPLRNLQRVCHGMATNVRVTGDDPLFRGCPSTFLAGRYHSWVLDESRISAELEVTAVDDEGLVMAARHRAFDVRGVQFHPESILSEHGELLMRNWLSLQQE
jgi:anthranilate synthase component II